MKNLKISKKLMISYGVILAMLILSIVISLFNLSDIGKQVEEFYNGPYTVQASANVANERFEAMQKSVYRATSNSDLDITNMAIQDAQDAGAAVQAEIPVIKANFLGDPAIVTRLEGYLAELNPMREAVLEMARQNQNAEAAAYMEENNIPTIKKAQAELDSLIKSADTNGDKLIKSLSDAQRNATLTLIILGVVSVIVSVIFAAYITRGITTPVAELEEAARNMAEGRLNADITYESRDELGTLAKGIGATITQMDSYIRDIGIGMEGLAKGDLTVSPAVEYKGDFVKLRDNIMAVLVSLNDTMTQINQAADQVASGSDQVSSGAQALSQGATEQASSVEELAATINEISNQVQENAKNAAEASDQADMVGEKMTASNSQMQDMIAAMNEISSSAGEIGKIIKTIEDIAFQTNILALNAAVEAARAGAAGKGFAVVADEVRNLASKSAEASKNTAALIEGALKSVSNGTQVADETAKSLLEAVEGAKQVTATLNKISEASKIQASSIQQVTQGVDQISSVVQTNSATAEESAAASEELSGQAQMLKGLVSRFRLRVDGGFAPANGVPALAAPAVSGGPALEGLRTSGDKY